MKISTWKNVVIGILVILNLAALSTIWFGHRTHINRPGVGQFHHLPNDRPESGPHDRGPDRQPIDMVMIRALDLNAEQISEFRKLKENHYERSSVLHNKIRELKEASFKAISQGDRESAERIADEIGAVQAEIEMMLYDHFEDIRGLCDEGQQARFDEMILKIGERIHPGPGPAQQQSPPGH